MTVRVEAAPVTDSSLRAPAARELVHHVKSVVGVSTRVVVCDPGSLPRSEGKARRVIDKRPKV